MGCDDGSAMVLAYCKYTIRYEVPGLEAGELAEELQGPRAATA